MRVMFVVLILFCIVTLQSDHSKHLYINRYPTMKPFCFDTGGGFQNTETDRGEFESAESWVGEALGAAQRRREKEKKERCGRRKT